MQEGLEKREMSETLDEEELHRTSAETNCGKH